MKRLFPILLFLAIVQFSSCEKDDICVEGDTPLLVIGFFDFGDTLVAKTVPSLRIVEVELNSVVNTTTDRTNNVDSLAIPLRIASSSTSFAFITNSADDDSTGLETGNIDTLTFNYDVREQFISRACGFVANFNGLDTTRQVNATDWIRRISLVDTTITNSNAIHVKIFH